MAPDTTCHDPGAACKRLNLVKAPPSLLCNVALPLQFQKLAHKNNVDKKPYTSLPLWWLGLALMLGGEVGNFLAYGWAPATVRTMVSFCMLLLSLRRECVAAQPR